MAGLLNRLAPKGLQGQLFVFLLRYDYGTQQIIEKLGLLHGCYCILMAKLPEDFSKNEDKKKEYNDIYDPIIREIANEIDAAYEIYDGSFEGQSCNPSEKRLLKAMRGIRERIYIVCAKSKIIDDLKADGEAFEV
jgi:hypothetical protein